MKIKILDKTTRQVHADKTQEYSSMGNKLLQHTDVLYNIQKNREFRPITIQLAPVEACDDKCPFCSVAERPLKNYMDWDLLTQTLSTFKKMGAKSVELSTDRREQITVRKVGDTYTQRIAIGDFVDSILGRKTNPEPQFEKINPEYEVMSCNELGNTSFEKITGLLRYKRTNNAFKVSLDGGLSIILSENHSICKYDKESDRIIKCKPSELMVGEDFVPWVKPSTKHSDSYIIINCVDKRNSLRQSETVPYFPDEIIVDEEFCKFLGIFIAEGYLSKDKIHTRITLNRSRRDRKLRKIVLRMGVKLKTGIMELERDSTTQIVLMSKTLGLVLSDLNYTIKGFGVPSNRKKIPDIIFNSPRSCKVAFLNGLLQGDGHNEKRIHYNTGTLTTNNRVLTTSSRTLADDVFILSSSLGYKSRIEFSRVKERKLEGRTLSESNKYRVYIRINKDVMPDRFNRLPIKLTTNPKKRQYDYIGNIEKYRISNPVMVNSIENNIRFSRVNKVEIDKTASKWFYDIEVENTKTFFSSNNILAYDTGGGNPLLYRDKKNVKNINDVIQYAGELGYDIGIITNSNSLKRLKPELYHYINWIRISLIKLDAGLEPEDYDFNSYPEHKLGFSYIIYDVDKNKPEDSKKYTGTTRETIDKISRLLERTPKARFVRIAGNCLHKGDNESVRNEYESVITEIDKHNKIFIKDIGNNDSPYDNGCYIGLVRPYISSAPHSTDPTNYHVYICTSHVLQKRNYDLDYSLCRADEIELAWKLMNYQFKTTGIPYEVRGNKGKNWTSTCSHCFYYPNNQLLHTVATEMPDAMFP